MKLRTKVIALVLSSLFLACLVILFVVNSSISNIIISRETKNFTDYAKSLASRYDSIINANLKAGEIYARMPILRSMNFAVLTPWLNEELKSRQAKEKQLANLLISDTKSVGHYSDGKTRDLSSIPDLKITMETKEYFIGSPVIAPSTGTPVVGINTPIVDGNTVKGVIAHTIALDKLLAIEGIRSDDKQYPLVVGSDGTILASPDKEQIMKVKLTQEGNTLLPGIETIAASVLSQPEGIQNFTIQNNAKVIAWSKMSTTGWVVLCVADRKLLDIPIQNQLIKVFLPILITVIAIFVLCVSLVLLFTKNIERFGNQLKLIMGQQDIKGDLTQRIRVLGKDELGDMAVFFNTFLMDLEKIFSTIKSNINSLMKQGVDLAVNMEETSASVIQINSNLMSIQGQSDSFRNGMSAMITSIDGISSAINDSNQQIEQQSMEISHASSTVEELLANLGSITDQISKLEDFIINLNKMSDNGKDTVDTMKSAIELVLEKSNGMAATNEIIKDIAGKTNLLAMNAAIEAAHAGESGRGFAVVSDEIRKLAEMASLQSQEVSKSLEAMNKAIAGIQETGQNTNTAFTSILSIIKNVSQMEAEIRSALNEQNKGSGEILAGLEKLREATRAVKDGSAAIAGNRDHLTTRLEAVKNLADTMSTGLQEIATGTGEINKAIVNVDSLAQTNKEMISTVEAAVAQIKTGDSA